VNEILESALEMVRPRLNEMLETREIGIKIVMDRKQTSLVEGSPGELREVLVNLLINAIEAMPEGGELTLKSRQEGNFVVVSVGDTGIGMTEDVKKSLFTPFLTTKGQKGLGMGLSVSYGIIGRHGGTLLVDSEPDKGTTFSIRLPATARKPRREEDFEMVAGDRNARILVIDDDQNARDVITEALSNAGYQVDAAVNGRQGLSMAGETDYALIIADLGMPDISGRQVARRISQEKPDIPILLITGWGVQLNPEELKAEGIDAIIAKPVSIKHMVSQVGEMLSLSSDSSNIES
jgi:CheY-like chemotaxis protein